MNVAKMHIIKQKGNQMRKPGKKVGSCHYVHKSAVKETKIPPKLLDFAKNCIPSNFEFHIIKWDSRTNRITLIQSPDWNKAHEPLVGDRWLVDLKKPWNECCKFSKINPNNPQIYHHKWMFVKDN